MTHNRIGICTGLCLSLLLSAPFEAVADEEIPDQPGATASADGSGWSLGMGLGFGGFGWGTRANWDTWLAGQAPVTTAQGYAGTVSATWYTAPEMSLLVERSLADRLALMLRLSAQYADVSGNNGISQFEYEQDSTRVGAGLGLRYLFNPGGLVEVSAYFTFQGIWQWGKVKSIVQDDAGSTVRNSHDFDGYLLEAQAGLVLERELIDSLFLRFATPLIAADYHHTSSELSLLEGVASYPVTNNGFSAGLRIEPQLQLRLAF
jgi:hypothetical protein